MPWACVGPPATINAASWASSGERSSTEPTVTSPARCSPSAIASATALVFPNIDSYTTTTFIVALLQVTSRGKSASNLGRPPGRVQPRNEASRTRPATASGRARIPAAAHRVVSRTRDPGDPGRYGDAPPGLAASVDFGFGPAFRRFASLPSESNQNGAPSDTAADVKTSPTAVENQFVNPLGQPSHPSG